MFAGYPQHFAAPHARLPAQPHERLYQRIAGNLDCFEERGPFLFLNAPFPRVILIPESQSGHRVDRDR